MNKHELVYLHAVIDQSRGADMDIGLGVGVLAALLAAYERAAAERDELIQALREIETNHVKQNRSAGRDESHSTTLRIARAAIAKAGTR